MHTMDDQPDYDLSEFIDVTKNWNRDPTAYLDRYYSLFYKTVSKEEDPSNVDVYVRQAPNKICVLGITNPSSNIAKVVMHTSKIGQKVRRNSLLCELLDAQDVVLGNVKANMEGKVLELNSRFEKECSTLLSNGYHMDIGYIAVIMPKCDETDVQLKDYQTEEEFKANLQSSLQFNNNNPNLETKSSRSCIIS